MKNVIIFRFSVGVAIILALIAVFAPLIAPYDPQFIDISNKLQPPSNIHILGTDHMGRDVLSRLIYGTRLSLSIVVLITFFTLLISFPIGIFVGLIGGKVDKIYTWILNIMMAFPSFLLSMAFVGVLGNGIQNIVIAVVMVDWVYYSRIIRNIVLQLKNNEYVLIAQSMGASRFYIMIKHILPFVIKPILVAALMNVGNIILMISGFSFLGIGVQPNISEWGMMLNDAKPYFRTIPSLVLYPGITIFISVMSFNLIGENFGKEQ